MGEDELDLTIVEATDSYRRATIAAPETSNGAPETSNGTGTRSVPVEDAELLSVEARVAHLESEVENWQRRTVIWRERALSAQALNEALNKNLDDLRTVVRAMAGAPHAPEANAPEVPPSQQLQRQPATVVEWCNRVFRRDFWIAPRPPSDTRDSSPS